MFPMGDFQRFFDPLVNHLEFHLVVIPQRQGEEPRCLEEGHFFGPVTWRSPSAAIETMVFLYHVSFFKQYIYIYIHM